MKLFEYHRASDAAKAVKTLSDHPEGRYLAGGTNLLDLMKDDIVTATDLVDLSRAGMKEIVKNGEGLTLGALATNTETANHPLVRSGYPLLSKAILAAATVQIRNMATNGGNILQRTRCPYFYDAAVPCNKRDPGSGCGALQGLNRGHAIFGASDQCVAVHPSDMAVALAALEATVRVIGRDSKERSILFSQFHRLPGNEPHKDNTLQPGDLIVAIDLPPPEFNRHYYYLKVRDRTSYAFALVSMATALSIEEGKIKEARIALGGVAHKPWRVPVAEKLLQGNAPSPDLFAEAAKLAVADAKPLENNRYKVELASRGIVRALLKAAGIA